MIVLLLGLLLVVVIIVIKVSLVARARKGSGLDCCVSSAGICLCVSEPLYFAFQIKLQQQKPSEIFFEVENFGMHSSFPGQSWIHEGCKSTPAANAS